MFGGMQINMNISGNNIRVPINNTHPSYITESSQNIICFENQLQISSLACIHSGEPAAKGQWRYLIFAPGVLSERAPEFRRASGRVRSGALSDLHWRHDRRSELEHDDRTRQFHHSLPELNVSEGGDSRHTGREPQASTPTSHRPRLRLLFLGIRVFTFPCH